MTAFHAVRGLCEGHSSCTFTVSNEVLLSDPCFGRTKSFEATWACGELLSSVYCVDGIWTPGVCFVTSVIHIFVFGGADRVGTCSNRYAYKHKLVAVLDVVQELCTGQGSCTFIVSNKVLLSDPCDGRKKCFGATWTCGALL